MSSDIVLKLTFFGLLIIAVALEAVGDVLFKKWALGNKHVFVIVGLIFYFVGTVF